jgi:hypothetical protein
MSTFYALIRAVSEPDRTLGSQPPLSTRPIARQQSFVTFISLVVRDGETFVCERVCRPSSAPFGITAAAIGVWLASGPTPVFQLRRTPGRLTTIMAVEVRGLHGVSEATDARFQTLSPSNSSTAAAITFITLVQNLKRKTKAWGSMIELCANGEKTLEHSRYQFPGNWL